MALTFGMALPYVEKRKAGVLMSKKNGSLGRI